MCGKSQKMSRDRDLRKKKKNYIKLHKMMIPEIDSIFLYKYI